MTTRSVRSILAGGLIAGTFDILFATSFWAWKAGVSPVRVLQSVAAGLLGRASFTGGWPTAILGLALHFFIATSMSLAYYVLASRWAILHRRPWVCGAVYGVFLYLVMNFVVIPLSAALPGSRDPLWIVLSVLVHMFPIGVSIALSIRTAFR